MARPILLGLALLCGCGDSRPCTTCPPLAGTYAVAWKQGLATPDCPTKGPQPQTLIFSQAGSAATCLVDGVELTGTIHDTYGFVLSGVRSTTHYSLQGTAVVGVTGSDAGVRIVGGLTTTIEGCQLREDYVADKVSN